MAGKAYTIHLHDALTLLESGRRVTIKVWKLSTGDILEYKDVICIGCHKIGGTHRIQLPASSLIREFRDVCLFEINGMTIFR